MSSNFKLALYWIARLVAAVIMLQTLFFKFTGAPESIYIFTKIGMEPWGRIGTGLIELVASLLILINPSAWIGAVIALCMMAGAIFMHLTKLGIVVQDDGGQLFIYAWLVTLSSIYILIRNKEAIRAVLFSKKAG